MIKCNVVQNKYHSVCVYLCRAHCSWPIHFKKKPIYVTNFLYFRPSVSVNCLQIGTAQWKFPPVCLVFCIYICFSTWSLFVIQTRDRVVMVCFKYKYALHTFTNNSPMKVPRIYPATYNSFRSSRKDFRGKGIIIKASVYMFWRNKRQAMRLSSMSCTRHHYWSCPRRIEITRKLFFILHIFTLCIRFK